MPGYPSAQRKGEPPTNLQAREDGQETCWILEIGSARASLSAAGLSADRLAELDYLFSEGTPTPNSLEADLLIRPDVRSGLFLLTHRGDVVARSREPRSLLAAAESFAHDLILDRGTGQLMFHGAVVARGGQAVWLSGPSGSGKSTLCAALLARPGFSFLSDDTVLWDPVSQTLATYPRPLRLKLDDESLFPAWKGRGIRFQVDYLDSSLWYLNPFQESRDPCLAPPGRGLVLECLFSSDGSQRLQRQSRGQGLCRLLENAHESPGFQAEEIFSATAELAARFAFYRLTYGDCHQAAARIEEALEQHD